MHRSGILPRVYETDDMSRSGGTSTFDFDAFDQGYLWNSYMVQPLVDFRSRLSNQEREALDATRLLTFVIRGFVNTTRIEPSSGSKTG